MRRRIGAISAVVVATLSLTACASADPYPGTEGDDTVPGQESPSGDIVITTDVDTSGMWVPHAFEDSQLIDPAWVTPVEYADGVFLGAREHDGDLIFVAVDRSGDVLWTRNRPASCSGFAITRDASGRALAVLTDVDTTDDALAGITASAYELLTGDHVWGPIEVPGPHQGPGLVFAAPPEDFMGTAGVRTALDPSTGGVAAEDSEDSRVLG